MSIDELKSQLYEAVSRRNSKDRAKRIVEIAEKMKARDDRKWKNWPHPPDNDLQK